jgi:hypothetical protein
MTEIENIRIDIEKPSRDKIINDFGNMIRNNKHIVGVVIASNDLTSDNLLINANIIHLQTNMSFRIAFLEFLRNHLNEISDAKSE